MAFYYVNSSPFARDDAVVLPYCRSILDASQERNRAGLPTPYRLAQQKARLSASYFVLSLYAIFPSTPLEEQGIIDGTKIASTCSQFTGPSPVLNNAFTKLITGALNTTLFWTFLPSTKIV
ncbi:hypothetical protein V8E54_002934 [Elaphomyces granulatus]